MAEEMVFDDAAVRTAWDSGANAWNNFVESGKDYYRLEVHGPALLAACQPVAGRRVLDLGCGQGYFCRQLAAQGAQVSGVDISEKLLAYARAHSKSETLSIDYRQMSASAVAACWPAGTFALATACMSLQDMADPAAVLKAAHAVLRPHGRIVFSVPHPIGDAPMRGWEIDAEGNKIIFRLDNYFQTGASLTHWNMRRLIASWHTPYWRRTLSEWSTLILEAGFLIRRIDEPHPTAEEVRLNPNRADEARIPHFLIFDVLRNEQQATMGC